MRIFLAVLILALAGGTALPGLALARAPQPSPTASPSPGPPVVPSPSPGPDDPARHKLALTQFLAWQQGTVDRSLYSDTVNEELTDDVLDRGTQTLANMGALQSVVFRGTSHSKGTEIFVYHMTCENGSVDMDFSIDASGKIGLIFFE